jgi:glucuronokinase
MEFEPPRYEPLDPALLPPLLIAWRGDAAEHSGTVHDDLRARYERGEPAVRQAMAVLADLARAARPALLAGDQTAFADCVDGSFNARRRMLSLDVRHVAMVECARAAGGSANYTGSGGAIVATCRDERHRHELAAALAAAGCEVIAPVVVDREPAPSPLRA